MALLLSALKTYAANPPLMVVAVSSEMRQVDFRIAAVFAEMCSPGKNETKKLCILQVYAAATEVRAGLHEW